MKHDHRPNPSSDPPTTRDGIESWLDVLTSMLSLPPSQRAQVRDELEDHLRSRVDDLLITGSTEPQAIRIAIAELGETAQLARHISSANRTPKSFRRFAMNATFFVLAGSILTAGVSMMMPSATLTMPAQSTNEHVAEVAAAVEPTHTFNLENASVLGILNAVADAFEKKLVISNDMRDMDFAVAMSNMKATLSGAYTFDQAMKAISDQADIGQFRPELTVTADSIVFQSLDEFKRSQIETLAHFVPEWVKTDREMQIYANSLENLLRVKYSMDYTSIQVVGDAIVVAAPPEIHAEINDLSDQLKSLIQDSQKKAQQQQALLQTQRQDAIARLKAEYLDTRQVLIATQNQMYELTDELSQLSQPFAQSQDQTLSKEERSQRRTQLSSEYQALEYKLKEHQTRYDFLQSTLIKSEYKELTSLIDLPLQITPDAGISPAPESRTISVFGEVGRPGVYELPDQGPLTLSRFLLIAGEVQNSDAQITLQRAEDVIPIGRFTDLQDSGHADMKLEPGDLVRVSTAD